MKDGDVLHFGRRQSCSSKSFKKAVQRSNRGTYRNGQNSFNKGVWGEENTIK